MMAAHGVLACGFAVLVAVLFQRDLLEGLTAGAVKG